MPRSFAPIIITAGGTGGHIFPAQALAEWLLEHDEEVHFITDERFVKFSQGALNEVSTTTIRAARSPSSVLGVAKTAFGSLRGIGYAMRLIHKLKPKAVVGFGGYVSFPTMAAALFSGVPTIIHEQNAVLGRANRMLAPYMTGIATSFAQTRRLEGRANKRTYVTGNPVRAGILAVRNIAYADVTADSMLHLLVTGGSQGATIFSQVVPRAIAQLPVELRGRIRIDQQCREADIEKARATYRELGVNAHLATFFADMPAKLASSHLLICRAGASSIAELTAAGRPAILVPYPSAMDNHQYYNAGALEDAGGGWVMPQEGFTEEALGKRLEILLNAPETLKTAAARARAVGNINATANLGELVLELADTSSPHGEA